MKTLRNENSHPADVGFVQRLNASPDLAHSYESLLSSLQLLNATRPLKTLLLTSALPEEGKTTVTINLALTMALAGEKVLIIDADLRKPRIHRMLQLENARGLADILTGSLRAEDVVQTVEISHGDPESKQSLSVITSGRISAGFLKIMGSKVFRESIESFTKDYEVILLDSPPVLSVSDALLVAAVVDGVILVLNTGAVTEKDARRAKERLTQAGGHVLGVVMNRFDEKLHGPGFHPYSSQYSDAQA